MKKYLFTIILALVSMASGAQTGRAFYMYVHGGNIKAFTKSTVDSIAYSNVGVDGKTYGDIVTQLIYTKDSLYKTPLSEIDSVSFIMKSSNDTITPGEAIDLGLSVKWASCNVGATTPEGCGGYYAWGETEEKSDYSWSAYKYYNGFSGAYKNIGSNISGTQYDVAHVKWGGSWRMPTHEEFQELCNKCTSTWTTYNGVSGYKFVGTNGNSIFLPAAGSRWGTDVYRQGSNGCYWTGTICSYKSDIAWRLNFDLANLIPGYNNRILGFSRSEEHTSELQSPDHLVCRLL